MRLLLINPNTSVHITERLARSARAAMAPGDQLTAVTAPQGPAVVRSVDDLRAADSSAIELADRHAANHDAIVLGISLDGVAVRLRGRHPGLPVVGMTEAALLTACMRSERTGLLTLGADLLPLYRQRVEQIGIASRVVAYQAAEATQAFEPGRAAVDPAVLAALVEAVRSACAKRAPGRSCWLAPCCAATPKRLRRAATCPFSTASACAVGQIRNLLATWQHVEPGAG